MGTAGTAASDRRGWARVRRAAAAGVVAVLVVVGGACSSGSEGSGGQGSAGSSDPTDAPSTFVTPPVPSTVTFPTATAPAETVEFRPVAVAPDGMAADTTLDQLGPIAVDGNGLVRVDAARDETVGTWTVLPIFSAEGIAAFNAVAMSCSALAPTCPSGQIAVVVDGRVVSAPTIESARFEADQIVISGDFDEAEAEALARSMSAAAHGR